MNGPELENVGAWPLVSLALGLIAWGLAIWAWFATEQLGQHLWLVLPAQGIALLAVICGHKARAAIRRREEPPGGAALAAAGLRLGYPVLLTALAALGSVVFFLCCGVIG